MMMMMIRCDVSSRLNDRKHRIATCNASLIPFPTNVRQRATLYCSVLRRDTLVPVHRLYRWTCDVSSLKWSAGKCLQKQKQKFC